MEAEEQRTEGRDGENVDKVGRQAAEPRAGVHGEALPGMLSGC